MSGEPSTRRRYRSSLSLSDFLRLLALGDVNRYDANTHDSPFFIEDRIDKAINPHSRSPIFMTNRFPVRMTSINLCFSISRDLRREMIIDTSAKELVNICTQPLSQCLIRDNDDPFGSTTKADSLIAPMKTRNNFSLFWSFSSVRFRSVMFRAIVPTATTRPLPSLIGYL